MRNVETRTSHEDQPRLFLPCCSGLLVAVHADPQTASAQQALKDQGFYYGEVTGTKDADTTAAIRRYQIRNGLQITGDLNAETRKSLGIGGGGGRDQQHAATPSSAACRRRAPPPPAPDTSDLRDDEPIDEEEDGDEREAGRTRRAFSVRTSAASRLRAGTARVVS